MATSKCRDCMTIVSNSAETCPMCGSKYPALRFSEVTITRGASLFGLAQGMGISVDGQKLGVFKREDTETIDLLPGEHIVVINAVIAGFVANSGGDKCRISIEPDRKYLLTINFFMFGGKFKLTEL